MTEQTLKHYVVFVKPGTGRDTTITMSIDERNIESVVAPPYAYAFQFHSVQTSTSTCNGEKVLLQSEPFDYSPRYCIGGRILEEAEVRKIPQNKRILREMHESGTNKAFQDRFGNIKPYDKRYFLLDEAEIQFKEAA